MCQLIFVILASAEFPSLCFFLFGWRLLCADPYVRVLDVYARELHVSKPVVSAFLLPLILFAS